MTALLKKISKQERTINVFNHTIMHGKVGVVKKIPMPSLKGKVSWPLSCFFTVFKWTLAFYCHLLALTECKLKKSIECKNKQTA